jgi:hypothetical protein
MKINSTTVIPPTSGELGLSPHPSSEFVPASASTSNSRSFHDQSAVGLSECRMLADAEGYGLPFGLEVFVEDIFYDRVLLVP